MCKEVKPFEAFAKKTKSKDGRQSRCNACMSKTMIVVYNNDRVAWNDKSKRQKGRKREWINEIKTTAGCLCCGEFDFSCLEFHHADPSEKEDTVAAMAANKVSDELIQKEISKCIVLCANCHRKVHSGSILMVVE